MDQDPFSIWGTPDPPQQAESESSPKPKSSEPIAIESPVIDDEDPGWGAPASTSPVKSKKPLHVSASASDDQHEQPTPADELPSAAEDEEQEPKPEAPTESEDATQENGFDNFDQDQDKPPTAESGAPTKDKGSESEDEFDDFDDPVDANGDDDDFGDFGDFDDGPVGAEGFDDAETAQEPPSPSAVAAPETVPQAASKTWTALDVSKGSTRETLFESVQELLPSSAAAGEQLSGESLRQVEGMAQVLISEQSRQLWKDLSALPQVTPMDWIRSRTRRDYLITMGVPVNLDEIHNTSAGSSSRGAGASAGSALPPLKLKLDSSVPRANGPNSAPTDGPKRSASVRHTPTCSSAGLGLAAGTGTATAVQRSASASGSPNQGRASPALGQSNNRERMAERRREELGLGPAPQVDLKRAQELVSKTEDQLSLLGLPALRAMLRELNTLTTSTSSLLTHHLTLRESYQADSEMYNSMIKELVTGAASRIGGGSSSSGSGSLRGGADRRATTIGIGASSIAQNRAVSGSRLSVVSGRASPSLRGGAGAGSSSPKR